MKLHTDFHDYYDTAIGFGIDSRVHYSRFTREVAQRLKFKRDFPSLHWDVKPLLLGFCGELFPLAEIVRRDCNFKKIETFLAYSYEELAAKRAEWQVKESSFCYQDKRTRLAPKRFFAEWRTRDETVFLENKVPVWLYKLTTDNETLVLNPKLKTYEFYRIKDAHAAFQEISMYLANILVEQKETASVEDKYRIEQHGFDSKSSFRKEKRGAN